GPARPELGERAVDAALHRGRLFFPETPLEAVATTEIEATEPRRRSDAHGRVRVVEALAQRWHGAGVLRRPERQCCLGSYPEVGALLEQGDLLRDPVLGTRAAGDGEDP